MNELVKYCLVNKMKLTSAVKPLYSGHPQEKYKCRDYRGVIISGVNLYYKAESVTFVSVLNTECVPI